MKSCPRSGQLSMKIDQFHMSQQTNQLKQGGGDPDSSNFFEKLQYSKEKNFCVKSKMSTQAGGRERNQLLWAQNADVFASKMSYLSSLLNSIFITKLGLRSDFFYS